MKKAFAKKLSVLLALTTAVTMLLPAAASAESKFRMTWYNVGAGDCACIQFPNGKTAVIDAGTQKRGRTVAGKMKKKGIETIDYLISSHPDADHCGGMTAMFASFQVKNFYYPDDAPYDTRTARSVIAAADREPGCQKIHPQRGTVIREGGATVKFVQADRNYSTDNEDSLIEYIHYGRLDILTCGDAEKGAEKAAERHNVDILELPHHGSRYSTSAGFIRRFDPERVVVSTDGHKYGHPNKAVFSRLKAYDRHIKVYRTDKKGDITAAATRTGWTMSKSGVNVSKYVKKVHHTKHKHKKKKRHPSRSGRYVYITPSGSKYHKRSCPTLSRSRHLTKLTRAQAKRKGYKACKVCF
ncbi:MAG: ComEC/Rec2 family competence protein [Anaerovoracaceae bacterium]|jgi:competence protein ComEC